MVILIKQVILMEDKRKRKEYSNAEGDNSVLPVILRFLQLRRMRTDASTNT